MHIHGLSNFRVALQHFVSSGSRQTVPKSEHIERDLQAAEPRAIPFLRWAGSKRKLLARLKPYWQPARHARYIEPFAGSACLFFELAPAKAVLGDANRELIETYRAVKAAPASLFRRLAHIPRDAKTYYRWRRKDPQFGDSKDLALRFLYLNRNCFNGIYRTNMEGMFNVPFGGKHGKPNGGLLSDEFMLAAERLKTARFVAGDFTKTLATVRKGDFVYLDPPFAVSSRRVFTQYGERTFDRSDIDRLAQELRRLHRIGADFLVSYADCAEARELASEWIAEKLFVRRNIAGFTGNRRKAGEWLISNFAKRAA
jgi:DNA adenine methylase